MSSARRLFRDVQEQKVSPSIIGTETMILLRPPYLRSKDVLQPAVARLARIRRQQQHPLQQPEQQRFPMSSLSSSSSSSSSSFRPPPPLPPRRTSSTSTNTVVWPYYVLASLPTLIWLRDSFVDVVRVDGHSMEPTLQPGDWILVRKADSGTLLHSILPGVGIILFGLDEQERQQQQQVQQQQQDLHEEQDEQAAASDMGGLPLSSSLSEQQRIPGSHQNPKQQQKQRSSRTKPIRFLSPTEVALLRSRVRHYEHLLLERVPGVPQPWLYDKPTMVVPGQVVVIKSPQDFDEWHIKRILALGGQWLQTMEQQQQDLAGGPPPVPFSSSSSSPGASAPALGHAGGGGGGSLRLELLPLYQVYVEGDHPVGGHHSVDSRQYGPVSKNCLVGVAECIVWPPCDGNGSILHKRQHCRDDPEPFGESKTYTHEDFTYRTPVTTPTPSKYTRFPCIDIMSSLGRTLIPWTNW